MRVALVAVLAALVAAIGATAAPGAPAIKSFKLPGGKVECVISSGPGGGALCIAFLKPGVKPFPKTASIVFGVPTLTESGEIVLMLGAG